jgi:hypothetical protein
MNKNLEYNRSAIYVGGMIGFTLHKLKITNSIDTFLFDENGQYTDTFYVTCIPKNPSLIKHYHDIKRFKAIYEVNDIYVIEYDLKGLWPYIARILDGQYTKLDSNVKNVIINNNYLSYPNIKHILNFDTSYVGEQAKLLNVDYSLLKEVGEIESKSFKEEETLHFNNTRNPKILLYPNLTLTQIDYVTNNTRY